MTDETALRSWLLRHTHMREPFDLQALTHLHVCVIDVHGRALRVPKLANSSAKPARRMRHAAAIVATPHWAIQRLPAGSPMELPSVLVLGGACDGGAAGEDGPPPGEER